MADKFKITILPDGTAKIDTDQISAPNHKKADSLLTGIIVMLGGAMSQTKKKGVVHAHQHETEHA